jgi:copper transport protein
MVNARFLQVSALALIAAAVLAPAAAAHAVLLRHERTPGTIRFVFDEPVRPASGIAAVRNGGGSILAGKPRVEGKQLIVPLQRRLADGAYTVRWRVISDDGHEVGGVVAFAVGGGSAVPSLSAGVGGPGPASVIARWVFFLGLLAAAGAAVFQIVIWSPETREETPRAASVLLACCFGLALAGALILLWLSHAGLDTRFGRVMLGAAAVAGGGCLVASVSIVAGLLRPLALLAGLLLLPAPTLAGHALDPGQSRLDLVVDVAHVTAAAVWLGGLLSLLVVVPRAVAGQDGRRALAYRFSALALASVALLVASGIWRAVAELSAWSQLWSTGYGRAILVKSALLAVTLGLAVRTRYLLLGGAFSRLRLGVVGESVVLLGIVVAVAFLTDLPPGRVAAAATPAPGPAPPRPPKLPPRDAIVLAKEDGRLAVALAVGSGRAEVTVVGQNATGVNGLDVSVGGTRASACGSGCYRAPAPRGGDVAVTVSGRTLRFRLPEHPRRARALVRRATAVFRSLRSVSYVERLRSRPGSSVVSRWKLQAPNRLSYTISGGPAGILIGGRRWDRSSPGGSWQESRLTPLRVPSPLWGSGTGNAHLVGAGRSVLEVSLLNRSLPAWFTIRLDRRTLRPLSLDMTAAAHFMHHRYTSFNHPVRIAPPR